jgi:CheY-like chemotaxis protein
MSTILIVEDDLAYRKILTQKLETAGYTAIAAVNGKDALAKLKNARVDLILLDLLLPTMDGSEFVYHLRQELKLETPIVVLTNLSQTALPAGIKEFLVKSNTNINQVIDAVKRHTALP